MPGTSTSINTLSKDSLYYFTLVPYTYNNQKNETYNYLTNGALSITKKPSKTGCSAAAMIVEKKIDLDVNPVAGIAPNPSRTEFSLYLDKSLVEKEVTITATEAEGRIIYEYKGTSAGTITFGNAWKAGVYFVVVKSGRQLYSYKVIKEE